MFFYFSFLYFGVGVVHQLCTAFLLLYFYSVFCFADAHFVVSGNYKLYYIINMCSCHLLLLHVCGAHNSKFDIILHIAWVWLV